MARNVPVSRDRDAHAAAHMVRPRGAALPRQWLGGGEGGARAARNVPVSCDRDVHAAERSAQSENWMARRGSCAGVGSVPEEEEPEEEK